MQNKTASKQIKPSKKNLCIVTTTRAEYGLLRPVIRHTLNSDIFNLQLVVSGTHLLRSKGYTIEEIISDQFPITAQIEMFDEGAHNPILGTAGTPEIQGTPEIPGISYISTSTIVGRACEKFSQLFARLQPDLVLILGDRFELMSIAIPAYLAAIPIVHLCGGDLTLGAIDDSIRHAVTKLATFQFVNNADSEKRVLQLGEPRHNVFNVGHTAIDNVEELKLLTASELEDDLNIKFQEKNILMTFHPVTRAKDFGVELLKNIFQVLKQFQNFGIFITRPNIDEGHAAINTLIDSFIEQHPHAKVFNSLGTKKYFSLMTQVDIVLGNSSSGLMEAPHFKIPTIDVGDREEGRPRGNSIIHCEGDISSLQTAFDKALNFSEKNIINPYGNGMAGKNIIATLEKVILQRIPRKKEFVDL